MWFPISDGGGVVRSARTPIAGRERVAELEVSFKEDGSDIAVIPVEEKSLPDAGLIRRKEQHQQSRHEKEPLKRREFQEHICNCVVRKRPESRSCHSISARYHREDDPS